MLHARHPHTLEPSRKVHDQRIVTSDNQRGDKAYEGDGSCANEYVVTTVLGRPATGLHLFAPG